MGAFTELGFVQSIWKDAKRWRQIPLGPIYLAFKFGRPSQDRFAGPSGVSGRSESMERKAGSVLERANEAISSKAHTYPGLAIVIGVGPGLGEALALLLGSNGFRIALVSRSRIALEHLAERLRQLNVAVGVFPCDVTQERSVAQAMRDIERELGTPELVIYAVQAFQPGSLLTTEPSAFEESWKVNCLGAFLVAREAARRMQPVGRGSILFAGATSGTIGRKGYVNLAVGKFGLRALSQVIARELGPSGIHVAHVVIDGDIAEGSPNGEPQIRADELAQMFLTLHSQPKSCWTSEVDARPAEEAFWEHC